MSITAAKLQAEVGADTTGFDKGMAHANTVVQKTPGLWKHALSTALGVGLERAATVGIRALVGGISAGVASLQQQGVVVAQTNAAIMSTKGAANVSAAAIRDLSVSLEAKSGFDDKAIQSGANLLLTFTKIRNEAGKGNDIFNQSTEILTNMARALGTDVRGGAIQLGIALNDPVKGIGRLVRAGVTFDDQQKKQIETMVKAGDTMGAQKIILAELNKEFGKSNAEFMKTDAGKAAQFQDAIEGIQQSVARGLLPAITRVRGALTGFLSDPATMGQAEALGNSIASIFSEGNLRTAASVMTTAANAIGTAIHLFSGLPKEVQALAVGAIALKKITGLGPLDIVKSAGGLLGLTRGASPATPMYVSDVAGGLGGAAGAAGAWSKVGAIIGKAFIVVALAEMADGLQSALGTDLQSNKDLPLNQLSWPWGPKNTPKWDLGPFKNILGGDSSLPETPGLVGNLGRDGPAVHAATALTNIAGTMTTLQVGLHADFASAVAALRTASTPAAIAAAVARLTKDVRGGVGNAAQTKALVADLTARRDAALKAGDKTLAAALTASIKGISPLAEGRAHQAAVLSKADKIVASTESQKQKIEELKGLQREMTAVGRTTAANIIQSKIEIVAAVHGIKIPVFGPGGGGRGQDPRFPPSPFVPSRPPSLPGGHPMSPGGSTVNVSVKLPAVQSYVQAVNTTSRYGSIIPNAPRRVGSLVG